MLILFEPKVKAPPVPVPVFSLFFFYYLLSYVILLAQPSAPMHMYSYYYYPLEYIPKYQKSRVDSGSVLGMYMNR
jgi:hypothetical protein